MKVHQRGFSMIMVKLKLTCSHFDLLLGTHLATPVCKLSYQSIYKSEMYKNEKCTKQTVKHVIKSFLVQEDNKYSYETKPTLKSTHTKIGLNSTR